MRHQIAAGLIIFAFSLLPSTLPADSRVTRIEVTCADNWYSYYQQGWEVEKWGEHGILAQKYELVDQSAIVSWIAAVDSVNFNSYFTMPLEWRVRCVTFSDTVSLDTMLLSWQGLKVVGKGGSIDTESLTRIVNQLSPILPSKFFEYQDDDSRKQIVIQTNCGTMDEDSSQEAYSDLVAYVSEIAPALDSSGIQITFSDSLPECGLRFLANGKLVGREEGVSVGPEIAEDCWRYFKVNIYADRRRFSNQAR